MKRSLGTAELPVLRPLVPVTSDDPAPAVEPAADEPAPVQSAEPNAAEDAPMAFPGPYTYVPGPAAMQDSIPEPGSASSASSERDGSGEAAMSSTSPGASRGATHNEPAPTASAGIMPPVVDDDNPDGYPPLILAASKGRLTELKALLRDSALDINQRDKKYGMTALIAASRDNKPEVVAFLLAAGAEINHVCGEKKTALMLAAKEGHVHVVKMLLTRKDIALDVTYGDGVSALYLAAVYDKPDVVACLLAAGAKVNTESGDRGDTPLTGAAACGHVDVVKTLLTHKDIALDETNAFGSSALFSAAHFNRPKMVAYLLAAGAKVNLVNSSIGYTALTIAIYRGHVEVVKTLLTCRDIALNPTDEWRYCAVNCAVTNDRPEILACLLAAGANGNLLKARNGYTTLMAAATWGSVEVLKTLLTHKGIVLDETDDDGRTALFKAAEKNKPEMVACLLAAGAKVNLADKYRRTALIQAAYNGDVEVVETLLTCKDIELDATDDQGISALSIAACWNKPEVMACLLAAGANVNLVFGKRRVTILMQVAAGGDVEVVKKLVAHKGIVLDRTDAQGWSALHWAVEKNKPDVVACLLAGGASLTHVDAKCRTALIFAIEKKHTAVLEVMMQHGAVLPGFQPINPAQPPSDVAFAVTLADLDADRKSPSDRQDNPLGLVAPHSLNDPLAIIDELLAVLESKQDLQQWLRAKGIRMACVLPVVECLAPLAGMWPVLANGGRADTIVQKRLVCAAALSRLALLTAEDKALAHYTVAGTSAGGIARLSAVVTRQIEKLIAVSEQLDPSLDIIQRDQKDGMTALIAASHQNKPDVVTRLLAAGAKVDLVYGEQRRTALITAAACGHVEVVKTLLTCKYIKIDETDADGCSVLFMAAIENQPDVVRCLLAARAKVNLVCGQPRRGNVIEAALFGYGHEPRTALMEASLRGHVEVVKTLLASKDIAVDAINTNGCNALVFAASGNKPDVVSCLLAAGAKVNRASRQQWRTALTEAAKNGHVEVVKMLLTCKDIALDETDADGSSALFLAALTNKPDVVACLMEAGASMTVAGASRWTALTIAIENRYAAVVEVLVEYGAALPGFQAVNPAQSRSAVAFAVTLADLDAERKLPADAQDNPLALAAPHSLDDPLAIIDELLAVLESKQDLQQWLRAKGIRMACALPVVECLASLAGTWPVLANTVQVPNTHQKRLVCSAALSRLPVLTAEGKALAHYTAAGISAAGIARLSAVATRQIEKLIAASEQLLASMGSAMLETLIPDCLARTGLARQVDTENLIANLVSAGWLKPLAQAIVTSWKSALATLESEPLAIAAGSTMQQISQCVFENTEHKAPQIFAQAMQRQLAAPTLLAALRTWIGKAKSAEGLDLLFQIQCDQLRQYCEQITSAG